uniref:Uncharacterized protein n=1 Tax=Steinernema glaseri TaxID=37863 RepID=A0A1I8ABG2_9BILA
MGRISEIRHDKHAIFLHDRSIPGQFRSAASSEPVRPGGRASDNHERRDAYRSDRRHPLALRPGKLVPRSDAVCDFDGRKVIAGRRGGRRAQATRAGTLEEGGGGTSNDL